MRKNELNSVIDKKIKQVENLKGINETYKLGVIAGLKKAKETIREFKRR